MEEKRKRKANKMSASKANGPVTPSLEVRPVSSQSRRDTARLKESSGVGKSKSFEQEETMRERIREGPDDGLSKRRNGLMERWRRLGVQEVSKSDRRMSVD